MRVEGQNNHFTEMCYGNEAGSYLRLIDSCITQCKAQGPSRTCNKGTEEKKGRMNRVEGQQTASSSFRMWHIHDSQGQILACAFKFKPPKPLKLVPLEIGSGEPVSFITGIPHIR